METTISIGEARRQLHETLRKDRPFDEKARTALELGRQYLGADGGLLIQIDRENNY
jgi:hypothetical protein